MIWNSHERRPTRGRRPIAADDAAELNAEPSKHLPWPGMECCCIQWLSPIPGYVDCYQIKPDCPDHPQPKPLSIAEVREAYFRIRGLIPKTANVPSA